MPANVKTIEKVVKKLECQTAWHKGSHARWQHPASRVATNPIHGSAEIGGWLFRAILRQMGITEEPFNRLK